MFACASSALCGCCHASSKHGPCVASHQHVSRYLLSNTDIGPHVPHIRVPFADQSEREELAVAIPRLFEEEAVCVQVATTGALAHVVALGDTFSDALELELFIQVSIRLLQHEGLVNKYDCVPVIAVNFDTRWLGWSGLGF